MAVSNKDYKVTGRPPADVLGQPPGTGLASDISLITGKDMKELGDGGNASQHPAKSQPGKMKYF